MSSYENTTTSQKETPTLINEGDFEDFEDNFKDSMVKLFNSALTFPSLQGMAREQTLKDSSSFRASAQLKAGTSSKRIFPLDTEGHFEETTKPSQSCSSELSKSKPRKPAMLCGLELDNIIDLEDDEETDIDEKIPVSSNVVTRTQVHGRPQDKIIYYVKYHPLDDHIRPMQAARASSRHGIKDIDTENTLQNTSDHLSGSETEAAIYEPRAKVKKLSRHRVSSTRHSSHISHQQNIIYDTNVYSQDNGLEELGGIVLKQEPRIQERDDEEPSRKRMRADSSHISTVPEDVGSRSTPHGSHRSYPQVATTPKDPNQYSPEPVLRYAEDLDVFDLPPGERYFSHGKNYLRKKELTTAHGEFTIYEESEEVQQAAVARAPAFCRHFDDIPKENASEMSSSESSDDPFVGVVIENPQSAARSESLSRSHGNGNGRSALGIIDVIYGDGLSPDGNPFTQHSYDVFTNGSE